MVNCAVVALAWVALGLVAWHIIHGVRNDSEWQ
jgi:hypothetical protein